MSLVLNDKDCQLGTLDYVDGKFVYSSNNQEKIALEKYVGLCDYSLVQSKNSTDEKVYKFFKEQFLDYIVERITLQDALPLVLRLLVLYSLVNGGLRDKDFDTVRKEVIQVWKND